MDKPKPKEVSNIFFPLDKTPQSQDSKTLFGGTTALQTLSKQGESSGSLNPPAKPVLPQNIFGNSSKVFESSVSSSQKLGPVTKEGEAQNLFRNSSSSPAPSSNIFGQVTPLSSVLFPSKPSSSFQTSTISSSSSSSSRSLDFKSVSDKSYLEHEDKPTSANLNPSSASVNSENLGSGSSAMFTLKSRETKDSDNIFGGNVTQSSPSSFKIRHNDSNSTKNKPSSSNIYNESSYNVFRNKDQTFPFGEYTKPERVFATTKVASSPPTKPFAFKSLNKSKTYEKSSANIVPKCTASETDPIDFLNVESNIPSNKPIAQESSLLIACDIPEKFLNKSVLENHFSKFGTVKKILLKRINETKQALIYFADAKAAQEAKMKGKRLHPLVPEMKLFFGSPLIRKRVEVVDIPKPTKPVLVNRSLSPRTSPFSKKVESVTQRSTNGKGTTIPKSYSFPSKTEVKSKAPSGNIGSIKEFSVLIKTQAKNNYDKFLILDARDKNNRAKQEKVSDLNKANYLLATCPDMCPEKERYSRDIQYDISAYEMTNNEIDHKLTVKKFSRSSADKDEPLPHELRPGSVLKMTMDFLMCNIVEKGDEKNVQIDLWYNYLCNRTRALRSDIMQQHLLDINAVYVLERCIRFHIHCSHHLCEESPEYFDAKMNSEHLSKSLQSLKELYHDLEERGYSFENESEFRAYEILLSINDGNIIFKYLNFKESVRISTEVQFAVKVLHSVHTNNYSNFFRLVKEASYLQACIMHRYFANMRLKALYVIIKAYSSQLLPMEKVMNMLGFTVDSEFEAYVAYFGIEISEDSKLIINKAKFNITPESRPPNLRSNDMITVKKICSIGEIISNGPLPKNPLAYYRPHSSFNSKGILTDKAVDASDQRSVRTVDASDQRSVRTVDASDQRSVRTVDASDQRSVRTVDASDQRSVRTVDASDQRSARTEKPVEQKKIATYKEDMEIEKMENTIRKKVDEMYKIKLLGNHFAIWKNFVSFQKKIKTLAEKSKVRNARKFFILWKDKAHESVALKRKVDCFLMARYFRNWRKYVDFTLENRYLQQVVKRIEETILIKRYVKIWKWRVDFIRSERRVRAARNHIIAFKYFKRWLNHTRELIAERKCDQYFTFRLLRNSFIQWKSWCIIKKNKNKMNFESFPAISSLLSVEDQNKLLSWGYSREDKLNISAHEIAELDEDIISKSRKHYSIQKLSNIVSWTAFPLVQNFQSEVFTNSPDLSRNSHYNCFEIHLLIDPDTDLYLLEWVRTKFNILEYEDLSAPLHCQHHFTSPHNEATYSIFISEEKLSYANHSFDCSSVVFLIGNENKLEKLKRYSATLQEVPFRILCMNQVHESLSSDLWLMTEETINNPSTSEKLFNFVTYQWQLRKSRFKLQVNSCVNIVSKFISDKILSPVSKEVSQRQHYGKASVEPSKVVSFYNSAISHIISCFEKVRLQAFNWPSFEVLSPNKTRQTLWNDQDSEIVLSSLHGAYLPYFNIQLHQSWSQIEADLAKYVKEVIMPSDWEASLYSEVKVIIKESRKKFFEDKFYCDHRIMTDKFWYCVPWIEVLNCFILFKLSRLSDINIAYKESDLEAFDCAQYWISELRISEMITPPPTKETPVKRKAIMLAPKVDLKKIKSDSRLLQDIEDEKQRALDYEKELEALMIAEEELKLFS